VNAKTSEREGDSAQAGAETLGARLRAAREARNLTPRELSDVTRITRRHLEAIEADDYKQLPGGIFNRSFVKSYARAVGFDEQEALRLYLAAAGEAADETPTRQHSRIYTDDAPSRPPLVTAGISLIVLAVISLAVYAGLHYYRRTSNADGPQQQANAADPRPAQDAQAANGQPRPADTPAPAATPAPSGLSVRVRARGEDVWLRAKVDDAPTTDGILAADETREFSASESLTLQYAKVKAPALEVTINGRAANVPAEAARGKSLVELLIRKDGYEQLLQQP
jgi:cytoskeleton protein RodZ